MGTVVENKGIMEEKNILPACIVETVLQLFGNKLKIFVSRELLPSIKRFGELQKSISDISQKVLTQNLRAMEKDGLIVREVFARLSSGVKYRLSEFWRTLKSVIAAM